jgi:hypothetical protein
VYSPADRNLAIRRGGSATGAEFPEGMALMHTESSDPRAGGSRTLERAIVLVLLSEDDGERRWSRAELGEGMDVEQASLDTALTGLLDTGVLRQEGDCVWPSSSTRRLDALELIGI